MLPLLIDKPFKNHRKEELARPVRLGGHVGVSVPLFYVLYLSYLLGYERVLRNYFIQFAAKARIIIVGGVSGEATWVLTHTAISCSDIFTPFPVLFCHSS